MTSHTSLMRSVAERLAAHESKGKRASGSNSVPAFEACMKLRRPLTTLMGGTGFRALLLRALALSSAHTAGLSAVRVQADGSLDGLGVLDGQVDAGEIAEGGIVLLAQLLGLLAIFIGDPLTLRIVSDTWPKLRLHDLDSGTRR